MEFYLTTKALCAEKLYLGNLDAQRDWGHAKDYIEAMWLILQQDTPEDFVIATGVTTRVREFVRMAFAELGISIIFQGEGVKEKGYVGKCSNPKYQLEEGLEVVAVDAQYFRPTEVELLIGDPTKANTKLGWIPKYDLAMLVKEMVAVDTEHFHKEKLLKENGYLIKNQFE
jgi:GDPmannose 4,6-dehydratase